MVNISDGGASPIVSPAGAVDRDSSELTFFLKLKQQQQRVFPSIGPFAIGSIGNPQGVPLLSRAGKNRRPDDTNATKKNSKSRHSANNLANLAVALRTSRLLTRAARGGSQHPPSSPGPGLTVCPGSRKGCARVGQLQSCSPRGTSVSPGEPRDQRGRTCPYGGLEPQRLQLGEACWGLAGKCITGSM